LRRCLLLFILTFALLFSACAKKIEGDVSFSPDNYGRWWHNLFTSLSYNKPLLKPVSFSGKLTYLKHPVPFARIEFYDSRRVFGKFEKPDFVTESNLLGDFHLKLPEKSAYYLLARKKIKSKNLELFAFYGDNPVTVDAGYGNDIIVPMASVGGSSFSDAKENGVYGRVLFNGKPLSDAQVYIYEDSLSSFKKYYTSVSKATGSQGKFYFKIPPGENYFFVVRKRSGSGRAGPLMPGDYYGFYNNNPLHVYSDRVQSISINLIKIPDYFNMLANRKEYGAVVSKQRKTLYYFGDNDIAEDTLRSETSFKGKLFLGDKIVKKGKLLVFETSSEKLLADAAIGHDGIFSFTGLLPGVYLLRYKLNSRKEEPVFQENGSAIVIIRYGHKNAVHRLSIKRGQHAK